MKKDPAKTAYIYSRISSKQQQHGTGIDRQIQQAIEYCQKQGFNVADDNVLADVGLSGYHAKHIKEGALGLFYERVEAGAIQVGAVLVIESLDRLSRETPVTAIRRFSALVEAGVEVHELSTGQVYSADSGEKLFVALAIMHRAHDESRIKSQRYKHVWAEREKQARESGKPMFARCPNWLNLNDGTFAFNEMLKSVKHICRQYLKGKSSTAIVHDLNSNDYPLVVKRHNKHKAQWNTQKVLKIINSKALYGCFFSKRFGEIEGYYPEVITHAEWLQIQHIKSTRRSTKAKTSNISNVFSGMLRCGYCGHSMALSKSTKTYRGVRKDYWYIRCTNKAKAGGCYQSSINYHTMRDLLLKYFKTSDLSFLKRDNTPTIQADLLQSKQQLEQNEQLYLKTLDATVGAVMAELRVKVKNLEDQYILEQSRAGIDLNIQDLESEELASNLRAVVQEIQVYGCGALVDMRHIIGDEAFKKAREEGKSRRHYIVRFNTGEVRQVGADYVAGVKSKTVYLDDREFTYNDILNSLKIEQHEPQ